MNLYSKVCMLDEGMVQMNNLRLRLESAIRALEVGDTVEFDEKTIDILDDVSRVARDVKIMADSLRGEV